VWRALRLSTLTREQEAKGYELLKNAFSYPGFSSRSGEHEGIRIWVYPSFQPFVSFSISKFRDGYFLRRVIWDYGTKTLTQEPQTYCAEIEVDKSVFTELVESLAVIKLAPYKPAEMLGIDGIRYGVTKLKFMSETTLDWWGCFPEDWHELREWHYKYLNKLAGLFDGAPIEIEKALTKQ